MQKTSRKRSTTQSLAAAGLALSLSLIAIGARADLIPPDVSDCTGKKAGDPCTQDRVCTSAECRRLDYANWDRDASPLGPPSVAYACLKCTAPVADAGVGDAGAVDAGASEADAMGGLPPDAGGPSATADAATATPEASTTEPGSTVHDDKGPALPEREPDEKSSSGCSVGGGASSASTWLMALLGACLLGRRRKTA
jgi:MYXO-CTERM domain-containing protein